MASTPEIRPISIPLSKLKNTISDEIVITASSFLFSEAQPEKQKLSNSVPNILLDNVFEIRLREPIGLLLSSCLT